MWFKCHHRHIVQRRVRHACFEGNNLATTRTQKSERERASSPLPTHFSHFPSLHRGGVWWGAVSQWESLEQSHDPAPLSACYRQRFGASSTSAMRSPSLRAIASPRTVAISSEGPVRPGLIHTTTCGKHPLFCACDVLVLILTPTQIPGYHRTFGMSYKYELSWCLRLFLSEGADHRGPLSGYVEHCSRVHYFSTCYVPGHFASFN